MYCSKCHKELPDGAVFCSYCGTKQDASSGQDETTVLNDSQRGYDGYGQSNPQGGYSQPNNYGSYSQSNNYGNYNQPNGQSYGGYGQSGQGGYEQPRGFSYDQGAQFSNPRPNYGQGAGQYGQTGASFSGSGSYGGAATATATKSNPKAKRIIAIAAIVVVVAVAALLIFGNLGSGSKAASPEYLAIFTDNGLEEPTYSPSGLKTRSFAKVIDNATVGTMIEAFNFGYKGDEVVELVNTLYVDTTYFTDEDTELFMASMEDEFAEMAMSSYCSYTAKVDSGYIVIQMTVSDLDNAAARSLLYDNGFIDYGLLGDEEQPLSMSKTADNFLGQGYIER